jgi:hypothetical protein
MRNGPRASNVRYRLSKTNLADAKSIAHFIRVSLRLMA